MQKYPLEFLKIFPASFSFHSFGIFISYANRLPVWGFLLREDTTTFSKIPEQYLSKIHASDIKQIERISITGGKDSPTSQNLSKEEISAFTDWMHQLRFHEEISRKEALSSGAVTYYHIFFLDGSKLTISPGEIMQMNDTYYRMNTEVSTIKPPC